MLRSTFACATNSADGGNLRSSANSASISCGGTVDSVVSTPACVQNVDCRHSTGLTGGCTAGLAGRLRGEQLIPLEMQGLEQGHSQRRKRWVAAVARAG